VAFGIAGEKAAQNSKENLNNKNRDS